MAALKIKTTQLLTAFLLSLALSSVVSVDFTGRYRLRSSHNFDAFLQAIGIGYFQRMAATSVAPDYIITLKGDAYTMRTVTSMSDSGFTFKDGVEFLENRLDGVAIRSVIVIEGNKWTQRQYSNPPVVTVREWSEDGKQITTTSTASKVTSVRKYSKLVPLATRVAARVAPKVAPTVAPN